MNVKRLGIVVIIVLVLAIPAPTIWEAATFNPIDEDVKVDHILIEKAARRLTVLVGNRAIKTYRVSLGGNPVGPKEVEGDRRTPEGLYTIDWRKSDSRFHRALHISYPTAKQQAQAQAAGRDPGGLIMIHGIRNGLGVLGPSHRLFDWTDGCIAVTNREIEELWRVVSDGTEAEIRP